MTGLSIGALNHTWETLADGTPHCILDEIVVTGTDYSLLSTLGTVSVVTGTVTSMFSAASKRAYEGSNRIVYFANAQTNRHFQGNQYVKVQSLQKLSKNFKKMGLGYELASYGIDGYFAYLEDGSTIGRNVQRSLTISAGKTIGASLGARIVGRAGMAIGGYLGGATSFGLGTIPAATIGEISGTIIGGYLGEQIGGWAGAFYFDNFY